MRIGIDARLTHYHKAGISRYTLQLIEALARSDSDDEFHILQSLRSRRPILDRPNFFRRGLLTPAHHRLEQLSLPLEISLLGLGVLHSPDMIPPFRRNCRSVITVHDLAFLIYPQFLTKDSARYYGQIDQAVRRTDAIIAVSNATKQDIIRHLGVPEHKVTVIHEASSPIFHPLEGPGPRQRIQAKYKLDGDFLLFVSTLEPRKNVPTLLRAFRQLLDSYHPAVKLAVVGEKGWLYDEVFSLVTDLKLQDDVAFLGRVPTEDLLWLYNSAQLLASPSFYEGFGFTPLEAMACGTPVVVSNVSSFPEVVGDAALLVDPNDADELAVAMWRLLSDSELRTSLIAKGLKRAASFSWDKAAQETLQVYHSLA